MNFDSVTKRIMAVVGDRISEETLRKILREEASNVNNAPWFRSANEIWAEGRPRNVMILKLASHDKYSLEKATYHHGLTGQVDLDAIIKWHNERIGG